MRLLALDLHQDNLVAAIQDLSEGKPTMCIRKVALAPQPLAAFLEQLGPDDFVVMESTMNAFWLAHQIGPRVAACKVLDTNAVHLRGNKTDALDARKLLAILSTYVVTGTLEQLPSVYVPSPQVIKLRSLFSTYRLLLKLSTSVKNRIHGIFRQNGIVVDRRALQAACAPETELPQAQLLEDYWGEQVSLLLEQLQAGWQRIQRLKQAIVSLGLTLYEKEVRLLTTIPGISPFLAVALMADIVEISRFPSAKKLCAYLRTAPSVRSSNQTRHLGPVSKQGRSLSITLLTQSANHFKTASPQMERFYTRLRSGKNPCKVRVALIRKIVVTAYYMLKHGTVFSEKRPLQMERSRWNESTEIYALCFADTYRRAMLDP